MRATSKLFIVQNNLYKYLENILKLFKSITTQIIGVTDVLTEHVILNLFLLGFALNVF